MYSRMNERLPLFPKKSHKLAKDIRLQPRFFTMKDIDHQNNQHLEGLDLAIVSKKYCDTIKKLANLCGNYLKSPPPVDQRTNQFFNIAATLSTCDPTRYTLQEYKKLLADSLDWITSEQALLSNNMSNYLHHKQKLESYHAYLLHEAIKIRNIQTKSSTAYKGDILYSVNYLQSENNKNQSKVTSKLHFTCDKINKLQVKIDYFTYNSTLLFHARNLLKEEFVIQNNQENKISF